MNLLTDDDIWKNDIIMAANSGYGANFETLRELARAIEAAVLEKMGKVVDVEPVAEVIESRVINPAGDTFKAAYLIDKTLASGTKLYPASALAAIREEAEAVRKANIDCVNHYDDCRAEVDRLCEALLTNQFKGR